MTNVRNERGIALAVAIFALVVIGALVAGSFYVGLQEQRVGRNTITFEQAFAAAEEGAQRQVANWDAGTFNAVAIGDSTIFSGTLASSGGWYRGSIRRFSDNIFLVRSEGFSRDSLARQQVGLLVRLRPIELKIRAALQTVGNLMIGGSSEIDGYDNPPSGWSDCPGIQPPLPGIILPDASDITTTGCSGLSCVNGVPKVEEHPALTPDSLTTFGDQSFDDLKAMATKIISGGTRQIKPKLTGGACDKADPNNWGDPLNPGNPCGGYFPVVWVNGDLTINGVQGQGVLIVDGNLDVQGGFEFFGPVIVRQTVNTQGTGGHFNGGVIAANVNFDQNVVLGDAVVNYSYCAVVKALKASAAGALLQERSWVSLN